MIECKKCDKKYKELRDRYIELVLNCRMTKEEVSRTLFGRPQLIDFEALKWFLIKKKGLGSMNAETLIEFLYLLELFSCRDRKDYSLYDLASRTYDRDEPWIKESLRRSPGYKLLCELLRKGEPLPTYDLGLAATVGMESTESFVESPKQRFLNEPEELEKLEAANALLDCDPVDYTLVSRAPRFLEEE